MLFRRACVACALLLLTGCGLIDSYMITPPADTAQELFENASDAMREKEYRSAIKWYIQLKDTYPFSPYTPDAELALGDAYFLNEKYIEAAEAYKDFEALRPRHEAMPYILYQVGKSYLYAFVSIDRPTTQVQEAIDYFNRLREMYPSSEYAIMAVKEIKNARKILAEHELYLADVFWQMERYGAAWRRYLYIAEHYSDVEDVHAHVTEKAIAAFYLYRIEKGEAAQKDIYGTWKSWFDWL